jgi:hypothetical protein
MWSKREGDKMGKITSLKVFIIQDIHHTQFGLSNQEYKIGGLCSIHRSDDYNAKIFSYFGRDETTWGNWA